LTRTILVVTASLSFCAPLFCQSEGPPLRFEVSSVKLARPGARSIITFQGHHAILNGLPVVEVIKFAYGIHSRQIAGGPAWIDSDLWDIVAEPEMKTGPSQEQVMVMLQGLLADRFKLALHHESRVFPAYALVVAKSGSKLKPTERVETAGSPSGPGFRMQGNTLSARNTTGDELAAYFSKRVIDRPVVNQSGLGGRFDLDLEWTPDETQFDGLGGKGSLTGPLDGPDIFAALEAQLGLKFQPVKAPIDILIIDRVERPDDN